MPCDYNQVRAVPKSKPNRKKKKVETIKGMKVPPRKKRSAISKKDYEDTIQHHGSLCFVCQYNEVQIHHCKFRSQGGKGRYRNLLPLCDKHHRKAHRSYEFAEYLRHTMKLRYGEYYWCDKYDLYKMGLISSPEDDKFERFMQERRNLLKAD